MEILIGMGVALWIELFKFLTKKLGKEIGVYAIYFFLFLGAIVYTYATQIPGFSDQVKEVLKIVSMAVLTFELVIKRFKPLLPPPPSSIPPDGQSSGTSA